MYFKYYDEGNMRIREFRDVKIISIAVKEKSGSREYKEGFTIIGINIDMPCELLESTVDRLAYLLCDDTNECEYRFESGPSITGLFHNAYEISDGFDASLCPDFSSKQEAENVMNAIAEAIARGDRIFDMTKYANAKGE